MSELTLEHVFTLYCQDEPCDEAVEWIRRANIRTLRQAWHSCPRADWMLWLLCQTGLKQAAFDVVKSLVTKHLEREAELPSDEDHQPVTYDLERARYVMPHNERFHGSALVDTLKSAGLGMSDDRVLEAIDKAVPYEMLAEHFSSKVPPATGR